MMQKELGVGSEDKKDKKDKIDEGSVSVDGGASIGSTTSRMKRWERARSEAAS